MLLIIIAIKNRLSFMWPLIVVVVSSLDSLTSETLRRRSHDSERCSYSFQVWKPNQDVLQRLNRLEGLIGEGRKRTHEEKLHHVPANDTISLKNMESVCCNNISDEIKQMKEEFESFRRSLQIVDSNRRNVLKESNKEAESLSFLKKTLGDLKAELLLLKRQFYSFNSQSEQLNNNLETIERNFGEIQGNFEKLKYFSMRHFMEVMRNGEEQREANVSDRVDGHLKYAYDEMTSHMNISSREELMVTFFQGFINHSRHPTVAADCDGIRESGLHSSGVYVLQVETKKVEVYCWMDFNAGWMVVQRRIDGSTNFFRRWKDYKHGFGSNYGEFWIGNEFLHLATSRWKHRLLIEIHDFENLKWLAEYDSMNVDSESNKYRLSVSGYSGSAGDSLSYHDDMMFSTHDNDNDLNSSNCALERKSGWWFNSCCYSNLNGVYHSQGGYHSPADGITWYTAKETEFYSFKFVSMKIKRT